MGTKVYVSSSISNLGQEDVSDSKFLPQAVIAGVISGAAKNGLGSYLSSTIISGQGMLTRQFFKWASNNYTLGMPTAHVENISAVDSDTVTTELRTILSLGSTETLYIINAFIDNADIDYFAQEWIRENHPTLTEDDWSAYFDFTNVKLVITVTENNQTTVNELTPSSDLIWGLTEPRAEKRLLYVSYNIITKDAVTNAVTRSDPEFYVYRPGSGNVALDSLFDSDEPMDEFYPSIPVRRNNQSIMDSSDYTIANKAFKKITGYKIDGIAGQIDDHENVDEIDHAFVVFGVPLNTKNQSGLAYIYRFFENLIPYQNAEQVSQSSYKELQAALVRSGITEQRWSTAFENVETNHPLYNDTTFNLQNVLKAVTPPPQSTLRIYVENQPDIRLSWNYIRETQRTGNAARFDNNQTRALLAKDEFLIVTGADESYITKEWSNGSIVWGQENLPKFYLLNQHSKNAYSVLEVVGMKHSNYIYGSYGVHTTAAEAIANTKESPFLVPLHYPTFKELGVVRAQEVSKNCTYLLINSVNIQRTSWLQDNLGWLLPVLAIGLSIVFAPAGVGLLGANATVGASLGFTGTAAVVAGAVANAIAASIVTALITEAAKNVFGEKIGEIVGAVLSFIVIGWKTGSFGESFEFTDLLDANNLIGFSNAVTKGYTAFLNIDTQEIYDSLGELQTAFAEESERILALASEVLGVTNNAFDPMIFTDATEYFGESSNSFLSRTLMTGSDIADISHGLIERFTDVTLDLPTDLA